AHVLLVPDRGAIRRRPKEPVGDPAPVGVARGDDLVPARVVEAGFGQERGVQGLVADNAIGAVFPGPHHRGGDVARAAPHRDAQGHARRSPARKATSRATSSRYRPCSRVAIGPGRAVPSPIVRPSMLRTGTTPAKVPVTKASSAE